MSVVTQCRARFARMSHSPFPRFAPILPPTRMRTIGTIPRQLDAERFSDYLLAQGMPNMVEESGAGGGG